MNEASINWWMYEELATPPEEYYEDLKNKEESEK